MHFYAATPSECNKTYSVLTKWQKPSQKFVYMRSPDIFATADAVLRNRKPINCAALSTVRHQNEEANTTAVADLETW